MFPQTFRVGIALVLAGAALARPAFAEEQANAPKPGADAVVLPETGAVPPTPAAQNPQSPALNFDLFTDDKKPTASPDDVQRLADSANLRRLRLRKHQIWGIATWALMATTAIIGQLNYNDVYGSGGGRTGNYLWPHRLLGYSTGLSFAIAGTYALLAPTPYKKPLRFDSSLVHRIAAAAATVGMVAQVALGFYTARKADAGNPDGLQTDAKTHLAIGYATLGCLTIAGAAWIF